MDRRSHCCVCAILWYDLELLARRPDEAHAVASDRIDPMTTPYSVVPPRTKHPRVAERFTSAVHSVIGPQTASRLEDARRGFVPVIPELLRGKVEKKLATEKTSCVDNADAIAAKFPNLFGQPIVELSAATDTGDAVEALGPGLRVGCVLSGGQAAGGHNCIIGLFDYLQDRHPGSTLYGFLGGPKGVMQNTYKV